MAGLRQGMQRVLEFLVRRVIGRILAIPVQRRLLKFEAATHHPEAVQQALLVDLLRYHAGTAFGRDHHFAAVRSLADFRRHVPVAGYDYVEPYLARVRRGEINALLADQRVHMFALTSGTTAGRKTIPVTDHYLDDYRRGWNIWGLKVLRDHRGVAFRPILQFSGDWQEGTTESGVPCGAVTGLTALVQKRIIRWLYCLPAIGGKVKDVRAKYYLALRLSLPRRVGMIIAANPSTMLALAQTGNEEKEALIRDIANGTLDPRFDIPAVVRAAVACKLRPDPRKAKELEAIANRTGALHPKDYWPDRCVLGNWTGGSVGTYLSHYPRYFGEHHPVRDVGLIASEGRMTIPFNDNTPAGVLDVTSHFFEFIPEAEGDSTQPTVLQAHELQEGARYFILLTTAYGLYRYHIRDLVRVTGFHNRTPLLEFLSKGANFSSLTGEKLSEYQVTQGMREILGELSLTVSAYILAPCLPEGSEFTQPYYGLFIEAGDLPDAAAGQRLAERLEARLCALNIEYASKRETLRLGPVRWEPLAPGFWQRWDRDRLKRTGGTQEQYKRPCLINDPQFARLARQQPQASVVVTS
jgi:hypothetical protein